MVPAKRGCSTEQLQSAAVECMRHVPPFATDTHSLSLASRSLTRFISMRILSACCTHTGARCELVAGPGASGSDELPSAEFRSFSVALHASSSTISCSYTQPHANGARHAGKTEGRPAQTHLSPPATAPPAGARPCSFRASLRCLMNCCVRFLEWPYGADTISETKGASQWPADVRLIAQVSNESKLDLVDCRMPGS